MLFKDFQHKTHFLVTDKNKQSVSIFPYDRIRKPRQLNRIWKNDANPDSYAGLKLKICAVRNSDAAPAESEPNLRIKNS
jgi:hypothetical protein